MLNNKRIAKQNLGLQFFIFLEPHFGTTLSLLCKTSCSDCFAGTYSVTFLLSLGVNFRVKALFGRSARVVSAAADIHLSRGARCVSQVAAYLLQVYGERVGARPSKKAQDTSSTSTPLALINYAFY